MKKILLIEDDADTIEIMEIILRENGYAVIAAKREITVKEIASVKPELIILDYLLPFANGADLCLQIKSNQSTKQIPILMYSANPLVEKLAIKSGADYYVDKPFDIEELLQLVAKLIRQN